MTEAPFTPRQTFDDPHAALAQVMALYQSQVNHLRHHLHAFVAGQAPASRVRAWYPSVRVQTDTVARADTRLSFGFVAGPGVYETTLTRPELFRDYYLEQFRLLLCNHGV